MRLKDKVAIVTGAGRGIGRAIAETFAREGASVAAADLVRETAQATADGISASGGRAIPVEVDVSDRAAVESMVQTVTDQLGSPNVLVNNAGTLARHSFLEYPEDVWDREIAVNLKGTFLCSQAVARRIAVEGSGGVIINLSSGAVEAAAPNIAAYVAAKGAIRALTKAMAIDLASHKIRVNALGPGIIHTDLTDAALSDPERRKFLLERILLKRAGTPQDVARTALFLVSDEASYITGVTLFVDGGRLAW